MRNPKDILTALFIEAEKKAGLEYIFTLLRVTGVTCCIDPLIDLELIMKEKEFPNSADQSRLFNGIEESLNMLYNLLNCSTGQAYKYSPMRSLYKGSFPNIVKPSIKQMLEEVQHRSIQANNPELASLLDQSSLTTLFEEGVPKSEHYEKAKYFLQTLIDVYKGERLKFKERHRFCRLPRFEVLELAINDTEGLYGFYLHFSNGCSAKFIRTKDSTEPLNIHFDRNSELSAFVGDLDALTEEWRVGDKNLYEIGLPGRYNKLGEWKPLVYPQRKSKIIDCLQKKALSLSNDKQVQGVLFYIMCTAHQAIEFVVKADMDLPWDDTTIGEVMHLHKCSEPEKFQNFRIYDGTYYLQSCNPEEIEMGIAIINLTLNTIAFAYNATLGWKLKYSMVHPHESFVKIEENDLKILISVLEKYPRNTDGIILNSAIDWYIRGISSKDSFAMFLCYYRVVEIIVTSIYKGEASFNLGFKKNTKDQSRQRSLECIEKKHNDLYEQDKFCFVTTAYSECIQGTRYKTEQVLQLVFGEGHKYIKNLFESPEHGEELSLYDIRNKIVHGNLTLLDKEQVKLVRSRLWDIQSIAKELIMRLTCSLNPSEELPKWSEVRGMAMSGYDPRTYLVANDEKHFPKDVDWRIKSEWVN